MNNLNYVDLQQVLYGPPGQRKLDFLNSRRNETANAMTAYQSVHADQAVMYYEAFNSDQAINRAKLLISQTDSVMNTNNIFELNDHNIRNVNGIMQQYVIANPTIYKRYRDQTIDGYNETFVDQNRHSTPEERIDYMNVMNGISSIDVPTVSRYYNIPKDNITTNDRVVIFKAWQLAMNKLVNDIDITDVDSL